MTATLRAQAVPATSGELTEALLAIAPTLTDVQIAEIGELAAALINRCARTPRSQQDSDRRAAS